MVLGITSFEPTEAVHLAGADAVRRGRFDTPAFGTLREIGIRDVREYVRRANQRRAFTFDAVMPEQAVGPAHGLFVGVARRVLHETVELPERGLSGQQVHLHVHVYVVVDAGIHVEALRRRG